MAAPAKDRKPEDLNAYIDRELRDTRARLHKVEGELEQALKRVWTLESDLRRVSEVTSVAGSSATVVAGLREELRQVRDLLGRMQERQVAIANRAEEALRLRSSEGGREKHDLGNVVKQLEALSRGIDQYENRIQLLEENVRKSEEDVAGVRLASQALDRIIDETGTRANRSMETSARVEQQVHLATSAVDSLRKTDEAMADRVNMILEQVHRHNERINKLEDFSQFPEEARDLIHRVTADRDTLAQRVALVEKLLGELAERVQNFGHGLAKVEQRQQVNNAQVMDLAGQVQETAEVVDAKHKRLTQQLVRQRRRQLDTLSAEIKELSQGESQAQT